MSLMLIPIGKVIREKKWSIPNSGDNLSCRYNFNYFLAHDVGVASNTKWFITGANGEQEISYEEAKKIVPSLIPRLGFWEGYSLVFICVFTIVGVLLTSSVAESTAWLLNTVEGILLIAILFYGGNYLIKKLKR